MMQVPQGVLLVVPVASLAQRWLRGKIEADDENEDRKDRSLMP